MVQAVSALLLALPVAIAGIFQIICLKKKWFNFLKKPIDGHLNFLGERVFGDNKTWLGVTVMGLVTSATGSLLWQSSTLLRSQINISSLSSAITGFMFIGASYSLGELPNSFMKRRLKIPPGTLPKNSKRIFFEFIDLVDGVICVGIVYVVFFSVPIDTVLLSVITGCLIHWWAHNLMIRLHLKSK